MNASRISTSLLVLLALFASSACSRISGRNSKGGLDPIRSSASALTVPDHLKYYGYYRDLQRYEEISGHSNFANIRADDGVPLADQLYNARRHDLKVMIDVQERFGVDFNDRETPGTLKAVMRPEDVWRRKWEITSNEIRPYVENGTIIAFYIYDEPHPQADEEFWRLLQFTTEVIKGTFPGTKIVLGYGWWHVDPKHPNAANFKNIPGVDWVGFNCYGEFDSCMDAGNSGVRPYMSLHENLKSQLRPDQRIFMVPEATLFYWEFFGLPYNDEEERKLIRRAEQYYEVAVNDPSVVAYIPFLWDEVGFNDGTMRSLRNMGQNLKGTFYEMGAAIAGKNGTPRPTPTPAPTPTPPTPENPTPASDRLMPGQVLSANQQIDSPDGAFRLVYQGDGNLVIYGSDGVPTWASNTFGNPGIVAMQGDGNLVIYDAGGNPVWASNTVGNAGAYAVLRNDGELAVYAADGSLLVTY